MHILAFLGIVILLGAIVLPQYWVKHVTEKNAAERPDMPGTGGELAMHLIEELKLEGVTVEATEDGDHYDPSAKTVRLSNEHFNGKSISAVAVAAHEVGHAIQDYSGDRMLQFRQTLMSMAAMTDKIASVFFLASPFFGLIARTPAAFFGLVAIGILLLSFRVLVQLVCLPNEYDASFQKALPILEQGGYLPSEDMPAAKHVLKAAALTYVAGALMSLVNLARWVQILR